MKVGVIDYGVGNLGSVLRAVEELRVTPILVDRAVDMHGVDCLILPGVGNFSECMQRLESGGWPDALRSEVLDFGRPLLGVCLGMQLLADGSVEGAPAGQITAGLGLIPGHVDHLRSLGCAKRVPHVGWNEIIRTAFADHLLDGLRDGTDFYFVHSYAFLAEEPEHVLATADYGVSFAAVVGNGRVWGTQFHPEKSSRAGFHLLSNFIAGPSC